MALNANEMEVLHELYQRGQINNVAGLRVIGRAELRKLEPYISPEAVGALLVLHTFCFRIRRILQFTSFFATL